MDDPGEGVATAGTQTAGTQTAGTAAAENILEIKNLSVVRGEKKIFQNFSLRVPTGCNTAILGPNGSGKSTFLKLLTRELYPVASPRTAMKIFGRERWNICELRSQLGIVSNDFQRLFSASTSGLDVVLSGFFSTCGVWRNLKVSRERVRRAKEVIEKIGLSKIAARGFGTFSTGEQRRFLLARALVNAPKALILDEPTSGLDLKSCFLYIEKLRALMHEGTTVILVTHNIGEISPEFSRVILLREGKIRADGPRERVLTSGALSALFEIPLSVGFCDGFYSVVPAAR